MDAELCILQLCQPELNLDLEAVNARLTRVEDQLRTGAFTLPAVQNKAKAPLPEDVEDEERPPMPDDSDAPPLEDDMAEPPASEAPMGFWTDLVAAVRKELKPPAAGFFVASANAPIQGALIGDKVELRCSNSFTKETIDKPHVLEVVSRKASAMLGRPVHAAVVDLSAKPANNPRMEQLMNFGRNHSDVVKIKQH